MSESEELVKDIEKLRDNMQILINKKNGSLIDPEVVASSEILNAVLNTYNKS